MPATRPGVAMLYPLSQFIRAQAADATKQKFNYAHAHPALAKATFTYLAGKILQHQFLTVVEEDVLDGTLLNDCGAIILTATDYLDPAVVAALEEFAAKGRRVFLTGDCSIAIKGATKLAATGALPDEEQLKPLGEQLKQAQEKLKAAAKGSADAEKIQAQVAALGRKTRNIQGTGNHLRGAAPLAAALKAEFARAGIQPPFESGVSSIIATRHAAGEVEYLFAVNATPDEESDERHALKAVTTRLAFSDNGWPVYDAVHGVRIDVGLQKQGGKVAGEFRFGPGQLRAFARTARPIGGVRGAAPVFARDFAGNDQPVRMEIGAAVLDAQGGVLSGSALLRVATWRSPVPPQSGHGSGVVPGAAPLPPQSPQATSLSTGTVTRAPRSASSNDSVTRVSRSTPRRGCGRPRPRRPNRSPNRSEMSNPRACAKSRNADGSNPPCAPMPPAAPNWS